jgi:hypothetical protein
MFWVVAITNVFADPPVPDPPPKTPVFQFLTTRGDSHSGSSKVLWSRRPLLPAPWQDVDATDYSPAAGVGTAASVEAEVTASFARRPAFPSADGEGCDEWLYASRDAATALILEGDRIVLASFLGTPNFATAEQTIVLMARWRMAYARADLEAFSTCYPPVVPCMDQCGMPAYVEEILYVRAEAERWLKEAVALAVRERRWSVDTNVAQALLFELDPYKWPLPKVEIVPVMSPPTPWMLPMEPTAIYVATTPPQ